MAFDFIKEQKGQQRMAASFNFPGFGPYKLTDEQNYAVTRSVNHIQNLKIIALAGTGKTSTLRAIARNMPDKKILYIAFNKTVQMEAENSFPPNVTAKTMHSVCYHASGMGSSDWKTKLHTKYSSRDYAEALSLEISGRSRSLTVPKIIYSIREAVKVFQHTTDKLPTQNHLPSVELELVKNDDDKELLSKLVKYYAPRLWNKMTDPDDPVPLSHDTYLLKIDIFQIRR